jgi:hypothetical protein
MIARAIENWRYPMTGQYQYIIGQRRIADLHREAERERLSALVRPRPSRARRSNPFVRLPRGPGADTIVDNLSGS